ncbi:MAG: acyl carrier protein [Planctomycetales bacterium 4484_123]|nr:MAG: acyl carrier protein [Planctomycetales bacterium 4484_123]
MEKNEIEQRVVKVVCEVLGVTPEMVKPDSNFVFDLGAESTQSVQLVAAFEEEFDIEMDSEEALAVETVGAAVDFIEKYVNKN